MSCPKAIEELSVYVDGELGSEEELSLRRHLDTCTSCQQKVKILSALKETVARSAEVHPVPHTLREALSARPHPATWLFLRSLWVKAAFAVVLILALTSSVIGWWWQHAGERRHEEIAQVLVADHIHYLQVPDALEISSANPAVVAEWFRGRVPFPVRIPRLNDARLLGGRLCSLLGQRVALVFYERGGQRLSLFILAADAVPLGEREKIQAVNRDNPWCLRPFGQYALCFVGSEDVVLAIVAEEPETKDLGL